MEIYIPLLGVIIILLIVALVKNEVTYRNRLKILNAIFRYDLDQIDLGICYFPDLVSEMESYDKTLWRWWDWGYTKILPPNYFKLIKPFIER